MEDKIKQLESENARLRDALKKITEHCEATLRVTDEIKDLLEKDKTELVVRLSSVCQSHTVAASDARSSEKRLR